METLIIAFIAGILTVLAPCTLPLLPFFLHAGKSRLSSLVLVLGLAVSILFFTLLVRAGTNFLHIPQEFWKMFSGIIIFIFALTLLFPSLWERVSGFFGFGMASQNLMNCASQKEGLWGRFLLGASLAPVFSSCSPTYFVILGTILPQSFFWGLVNLLVYILGLSLIFAIIALGAHAAVKKMSFAANPNGIFKKVMGVIFLLLAIAIFTGFDKHVEAWILMQDWYPNSAVIESQVQEFFR